jgi:hypothetical protein
MKKMPSARLLRRLIDYDPATGEMRWKERDPWMFNAASDQLDRICKAWNAQFAGKPCFYKKMPNGYLTGSIMNRQYYAHRVAYAVSNEQPLTSQIDHINGKRSDNRLCNLRAVTASENLRNMRRSKANKSGVTGVFYDEANDLWVSSIRAHGRNKHIGRFARKEDAIAARKAAERKYGFHPNHGRAA